MRACVTSRQSADSAARCVVLAAVVALASLAISAPTARAQARCERTDEPCLFKKGLERLIQERFDALGGQFKIQPDGINESLKPGNKLEAELQDKNNPARSNPLVDRVIDLGDGSFNAPVDVKIILTWSVHDKKTSKKALDGRAVNISDPKALLTSFVFAPALAEAGLDVRGTERFLRVRLAFEANPPEVRALVRNAGGDVRRLPVDVDLRGASDSELTEIEGINLGKQPGKFDVPLDAPVLALPLELPSIFIGCGNRKCAPGGKHGYALVLLRPGSVPAIRAADPTLNDLQATIGDLRGNVRALKSFFDFFGDIEGDLGKVLEVLDKFEEGTNMKLFARDSVTNLNAEPDFEMISRGPFKDDEEAEDTLSSIITFGLSSWDVFGARNHKRKERSLMIEGPNPAASIPGQVTQLLNNVEDLHVSKPQCVRRVAAARCRGTRPTSKKLRKSWGDVISSLRAEPAD